MGKNLSRAASAWALSAAAVVAAAACSTAAQQTKNQNPSDAVATVGSTAITLAQLDESALQQPASNFGGIKLSHLLFPLPTAIIGVTIYALMKLFGEVYALTNRTLQLRNSLGNRLKREIPLSSIISILARDVSGKTSVELNAVAVE